MTKNWKKFNVFVFISSLARSLIEIFIPLYLYKTGVSFQEILLFYLFISGFSCLISFILLKLGKLIPYKYFIFISSISFIITYFLLNSVALSTISILILALSYAIYRRSYWMVKRYYSIKYAAKRNSGKASAWVTITSEGAGLISSLLGGVFLDNQQFMILALISLILFIISIVPLFSIKDYKENKNKPAAYKSILKSIPIQNYLILFLYEGIFYVNLFFPLYLYIYVDNTYSFVGLINLVIGISSMIFVWTFAKKMDKDKHDYLRLITFILGTIFLVKLNITNPYLIAIIALLEGYVAKMHTVSYSRNIWYLGKNYNTVNYNFIMEMITNISRFLIIGIFYFMKLDIITCIFIGIILFGITCIFKFDDGKGGYY